MYPHVVHVFVDGGYLRSVARERSLPLLNPRKLGKDLAESGPVQTWAYNPTTHPNALLARTSYYDALPDPSAAGSSALEDYWKAVEVLDDVHMGFGSLKGLRKKARQKGVDVQIAVDMLVGAFAGIFDIAILVAGDADFVPVVEEVKRRGVMVAIAASSSSLSDDLRRAADRFIDIPVGSPLLAPLQVAEQTFPVP